MSSQYSSQETHWFVIHTHLRQEDRAEANLKSYKAETFTPKIKTYQRNSFTGASSSIIKPLFPRYIFARFKMSDLIHRVNFTGGVHSVVSFGGSPAVVDNETIDIIKSRIGEDGLVRTYDELKPGDEVLIQEGPLRNFVGVFDRAKKDSDRIMILLSTVSYQPLLEIKRDQVRKVV